MRDLAEKDPAERRNKEEEDDRTGLLCYID